jgi:hypothetical protein
LSPWGGRVALGLLAMGPCAFGFNQKPTAVVFPSGPTVPENLLRIELRFSAPLPVPFSMDYVRLIRTDGREIERAFLDLPLPSADGTRVTILMAPARVKSGLSENLVLGRALRAGSTVTLVIDDPALSAPIRKTWRVTGFDAEPPRPALWTLDRPVRGTRHALLIHLHTPLSSTAEGLIAIRGPDGRRVSGVGQFENGETLWRFTPKQPWQSGVYAVVTHPELEDPAGNRPCGPFESVAASVMHCGGTTRAFKAIGAKEKS